MPLFGDNTGLDPNAIAASERTIISAYSVITDGTTIVTVTCATAHHLSRSSLIYVSNLYNDQADGFYYVSQVMSPYRFTYQVFTPIPAAQLFNSRARVFKVEVGYPYGYTSVPTLFRHTVGGVIIGNVGGYSHNGVVTLNNNTISLPGGGGTYPSSNNIGIPTSYNSSAVTIYCLNSTTATVTYLNHGFNTGDWVTISETNNPYIDGTFQITVIDANSFIYTASGITTYNGSGICVRFSAYNAGTNNIIFNPPIYKGVVVACSKATIICKKSNISCLGSNIATVTCENHGFSTGNYVTVTGATNSNINGTFQITVINSGVFTYTLSEITTYSGVVAVTGNIATVNYINHGFSTGHSVVVSGTGDANIDGTFNITVIDANTFTYVTNANTAYYGDAAVTGTVATVTYNNHGFTSGDYVIVSGAADANINGTFQITVVDENTFTYETVSATSYYGNAIISARDTSFQFLPQENGTSYDVQVIDPAGQQYTITNGSGSVSGSNITNVIIEFIQIPVPASNYYNFYRFNYSNHSSQVIFSIDAVKSYTATPSRDIVLYASNNDTTILTKYNPYEDTVSWSTELYDDILSIGGYDSFRMVVNPTTNEIFFVADIAATLAPGYQESIMVFGFYPSGELKFKQEFNSFQTGVYITPASITTGFLNNQLTIVGDIQNGNSLTNRAFVARMSFDGQTSSIWTTDSLNYSEPSTTVATSNGIVDEDNITYFIDRGNYFFSLNANNSTNAIIMYTFDNAFYQNDSYKKIFYKPGSDYLIAFFSPHVFGETSLLFKIDKSTLLPIWSKVMTPNSGFSTLMLWDLLIGDDSTIYVCGASQPSNSSSQASGFLGAIDTDGNFLWKKQLDVVGVTDGYSEIYSICFGKESSSSEMDIIASYNINIPELNTEGLIRVSIDGTPVGYTNTLDYFGDAPVSFLTSDSFYTENFVGYSALAQSRSGSNYGFFQEPESVVAVSSLPSVNYLNYFIDYIWNIYNIVINENIGASIHPSSIKPFYDGSLLLTMLDGNSIYSIRYNTNTNSFTYQNVLFEFAVPLLDIHPTQIQIYEGETYCLAQATTDTSVKYAVLFKFDGSGNLVFSLKLDASQSYSANIFTRGLCVDNGFIYTLCNMQGGGETPYSYACFTKLNTSGTTISQKIIDIVRPFPNYLTSQKGNIAVLYTKSFFFHRDGFVCLNNNSFFYVREYIFDHLDYITARKQIAVMPDTTAVLCYVIPGVSEVNSCPVVMKISPTNGYATEAKVFSDNLGQQLLMQDFVIGSNGTSYICGSFEDYSAPTSGTFGYVAAVNSDLVLLWQRIFYINEGVTQYTTFSSITLDGDQIYLVGENGISASEQTINFFAKIYTDGKPVGTSTDYLGNNQVFESTNRFHLEPFSGFAAHDDNYYDTEEVVAFASDYDTTSNGNSSQIVKYDIFGTSVILEFANGSDVISVQFPNHGAAVGDTINIANSEVNYANGIFVIDSIVSPEIFTYIASQVSDGAISSTSARCAIDV